MDRETSPRPAGGLTLWCAGAPARLRRVLEEIVSRRPGWPRCRCFDAPGAAVDALGGPQVPALLLMHLAGILPGHVRLLTLARERSPRTGLVLATGDDDPDRVLAALRAGVDGLVGARAGPDEVAQALDAVAAGGSWVGPAMTRHILGHLRRPGAAAAAQDYGLSAGERAILEQLVRGLTTKEVAAALGIPYHRVDRRMRDLYGKLGEHTRGGVVARATRERILERAMPDEKGPGELPGALRGAVGPTGR